MTVDPWLRRAGSKVAALLVMASGLLLVGCAGEDVPEVTNGDPVLIAGRDIYTRSCASCHGAQGGGGRGRQINNGVLLLEYPDVDDQISLVAVGRNQMPGFAGRLSDEEIEAVVRYTREVLSTVS